MTETTDEVECSLCGSPIKTSDEIAFLVGEPVHLRCYEKEVDEPPET